MAPTGQGGTVVETSAVPANKQVLPTIRVQIGSLSPGERKVANVILEAPNEVIHMTVG